MFGRKRRKNEEYKGKKTETIKVQNKIFDVLNRVPVDYRYTTEYVRFLNGAQKNIEKMMNETDRGSGCLELFHEYIGAFRRQMKEIGREEYVHRMYLIEHHRGILNGEVESACRLKEKLEEELKKEKETIQTLETLKKRAPEESERRRSDE